MKYEINDETLAILPFFNNKTKVIEVNEEYIVDENPYSIMEYSCKYFGSSLNGRIQGAKDILGSVYKSPVMVEETQKLIFFPTEAIDSNNTGWIAYKNICSVEKYNNKSLVKFNNGIEIIINCPYFSIKNQIFRCNILESVANNRKSNKKTINS